MPYEPPSEALEIRDGDQYINECCVGATSPDRLPPAVKECYTGVQTE
jgi:hypothetical protein